jgi:pyrroloquinoline-quinone synthase
VLNRFYYQTRIPIKDAIIVSKSDDPAFRRAWH